MSDCQYQQQGDAFVCIHCGDKRSKLVHRNCPKVKGGSECIHRGPVIGQHTCETCGMRGQTAEVHQCELLAAPCVLRPWTNLRRKMSEAGETACITCRERTLADGRKPWEQATGTQGD